MARLTRVVHWPIAFQFQGHEVKQPKVDGKMAIDTALTEDVSATWAAMEDLVSAGLVKNIGISNFSVQRIEKLLSKATIPPAVNQVELHPYLSQQELLNFCHGKGIHLTAYSPLGSQDSHLLTDEKLVTLAKEKDVDVGRLLIAWALTRGTSVIPKSVTESRIQSNFLAKDVSLSTEDIQLIDSLDQGHRFVNPSKPWGVDIYGKTGARL